MSRFADAGGHKGHAGKQPCAAGIPLSIIYYLLIVSAINY